MGYGWFVRGERIDGWVADVPIWLGREIGAMVIIDPGDRGEN
jgi:hypothetical protein